MPDAGLVVHWLLGDMHGFPQHSWDGGQGRWTGGGECFASLVNTPTDPDAGAGEPGDFWEDMSKDECGDELAILLMELKFQAKPVTAKHVCLIAFWASKGGCQGKLSVIWPLNRLTRLAIISGTLILCTA